MRKSRYRQTLRFFTRVMIGEIGWDFLLPRIGLGALARRTRPARMRRIAVDFRALAIRMGGVLIKVGQFLSSRLDVLPREITAELAGLQDEVGAESFAAIRREVEAEFGVPLAEKFLDFEPVPLASASIGQVHRARLRGEPAGQAPSPPVVVKVQRPRIQEIVEADLAAIRVAGGWLQRLKTVSRHVNVPAPHRGVQPLPVRGDRLPFGREERRALRGELQRAPRRRRARGGLEPHHAARSHPAGCRRHQDHRLPGHRGGGHRQGRGRQQASRRVSQTGVRGRVLPRRSPPGNLFVLPEPGGARAGPGSSSSWISA